LYRAKRAGKDRTEVATEAPRPPQATESTRDAA
jgi:hypothetical protein